MDAFYASVEQRDNPELRGQPVAVGGDGSRGVVAAASYEARRFGVRSAMPAVTARRKCPQLIFIRPRFDAYREASRQIHRVFHRYTDLVEPLSLDEAYLDVTRNKAGLDSATELARQIKRDIGQETALTASAGVSVNKFLAKIASDYDKPDGLYVIRPQQVLAFIEQLPIERFFGVGKVTARRMRALGIVDGASLKQWGRADLMRHFGKSGSYFYDIAHGHDDRPVEARRVRKSLGAECTYSQDLVHQAELNDALSELADEVALRLQKADKQGRTITLKVRFADFTQVTRSISLDRAVSDAATLFEHGQRLLASANPAMQPIRLLGITLSNFAHSEDQGAQLPLDL